MKYHRVEERHFLIYERSLIWEGGTSHGALISVADNMLIMICGDGDFRVNLRKRHEVDPRWEFRMFEPRRGEKYRGVPHAELKEIVNHRYYVVRVSSQTFLNPRKDPILHIYITLFLHFLCIFQFLSVLTFFFLYTFCSLFRYFLFFLFNIFCLDYAHTH